MLCCDEKINQSKPLIDFDIFQPTRCLSNLDEIAIRVSYVTANLNAMVLWLCNEFSSSAFPFLIRGPDISYTNNHEITGFLRVPRCLKSYSWLIISWVVPTRHLGRRSEPLLKLNLESRFRRRTL